MLAGLPLSIWAGFLAFVIAMLALDLGVLRKSSHKIGMKEALTWSGVWIGLALIFNVGLALFWNRLSPNSSYTSSEAGLAFLTAYLVEKALSVDNIFVFLVVFSYFRVPEELQHRVLFWGIFGALIFRAIFIALGAVLLAQFAWMTLVFGAFLILTGFKMLAARGKEPDPGKNPVLKLIRRFMPVTDDFRGQAFSVREAGKWIATPLLVTLLFVEFTDIVFAVDSIPAVFAVTRDPFIVFTSNVFAILGLRALFFALAGLMEKFHLLSIGLALVLVFVGGKMSWTYLQHMTGSPDYKFPILVSLGVIAGLITASIVASLRWPKPVHPSPSVP